MQRKVVELYHRENGVPGYQMICDYLKQSNIIYSCNTVYRYMLDWDYSIVHKKKPMYVKGKINKVFPNLLSQNFKTEAPNKIWCTDFTYLPQKKV